MGILQRQGRREMAEKIKHLNLKRDYKSFLYYIDGDGNVCQKPKSRTAIFPGPPAALAKKRKKPHSPIRLAS
jgi:hypothetical protein